MPAARGKTLSLQLYKNPKSTSISTATLRKELKDYINKADDRFIKLIYGMISADREEHLQVPESHKKIIHDRLENYKKDPDNVLS